MFDLTNTKSLDALDKLVHEYKESCPIEAQDNIVLVGTKLDDVDNRKVSRTDALEVCS